MLTFLVKTSTGFEPRTYRNVLAALNSSHTDRRDLYEEDDDEPNLLYSDAWDIPMKRAVWRTMLSTHGMDPYNRNLLPDELKGGTSGSDFEVR